jgi:hypothetical protein
LDEYEKLVVTIVTKVDTNAKMHDISVNDESYFSYLRYSNAGRYFNYASDKSQRVESWRVYWV